ncbi:MAG: HAMP domain-containing histidine kinase [Actinomycetota bacterium]|nr:HAMP domain-containing histidine kinase [Actinomycetota bacterium]
MAGSVTPATAAPQRSSMESFLDEFQKVRLYLSIGGLALIAVFAGGGRWNGLLLPSGIGLLLMGIHAAWCRHRHIRSPRSMLALDLTIWGSMMLLMSDFPALAAASLAFLSLLTVLFSDGRWMATFLLYVTTWFGISFFAGTGLNIEDAGVFVAIVFTVGGMDVVMYRVRGWLGQLDGNRSQMLGTVSHELRNNLTGMMGLTDVLQSATDMSPSETKELLGLAHQQAVDASEIVEDLLTASRLESSALSVDVEAVDLNLEVATTVRRFVGEGTQVSIEVEEDVPLARGDSLRVRQILRNLISNAVRYGGSAIHLTTRVAGEHVQVVVSDNGEGVPAEDEATIFLPYRRSINARRDSASVGLGLWICRQLAQAMGGTLEYRRVEESTQFVLTLGAHDRDPARSPQALAASGARPLPILPDSGILPAVSL